MTAEELVKAMLNSKLTTVTDARITHAYRLQDSDLPAITFEISEERPADLSGTNLAQLAITAIAETTKGAADLLATVISDVGTFTSGTYKIHAVVFTSSTVNPPVAGMSDEQEPATAVANFDIYWS